jgi:hypothetical protein
MSKNMILTKKLLLAISLIALFIIILFLRKQIYATDSQIIGTTTGGDLGANTGWIRWGKFLAIESGDCTSLSVYCLASGNVRAAIYSNNATANNPDQLLSQSASTYVIGGGWRDISIASTPLISGNAYWLGVQSEEVNVATTRVSGSSIFAAQAQSYGEFPQSGLSALVGSGYEIAIKGLGTASNPPNPPMQTADFYGDSVTVGWNASNIGVNDWTSIVCNTDCYAKNNQSVSSVELADMAGAVYSTPQTSNSISMMLLGINDVSHLGTNADGQTGFQRAMYSLVAKLAIPTGNIKWGQDSSIAYAGVWDNTDLGWGNHTKLSSTNGSTATISLAGSIIYINILQYSGSTRGINVNIDGADKGTFSGATFVPTNAGKSYAPYLLRFAGLANTAHNVVLTVTDGTGNAYLNWAASLSGSPQTSYPKVYVGSILKMIAYATSPPYPPCWGNGSEIANSSLNSKISEVVSTLAGDGLNIKFVNLDSVYNLATDVSSDSGHPNDLGHIHIATAFLNNISGSNPPVLPQTMTLSVQAIVSQWDHPLHSGVLQCACA